MNLSMMSCMIGSSLPPSETIEAARYANIDAVDWITCHNTPAKELKKMSDDAGLKIVAYTDFAWKFQDGREDWKDEYRTIFDNAAALNAPVVMIPPFAIKGKDLKEGFKAWKDYYCEVTEEAKKYPFTLTLESTGMATSPVVTGEEVLEILQAAPGLKVTFDEGNTSTACDPLKAYDLLKDHVVHFHLKDWLIYDSPAEGTFPNRDGRHRANIIIGEGMLDLKAFWDIVLPEQKKNCYVNLETFDFTGKTSKKESIKKVADLLRNW
ncbi:MAG: sugar phosphate isomerase/epimerase [Lentisphaeria bacterium]|nr:sugar phosphate isomerase/epimerase [Lentisphaeria bacterium]